MVGVMRALLLLIAIAANAEPWKASVAALTATNAVDAYTTLHRSPGFIEVNPMGRVVLGKTILLPLIIWEQHRFIKRHPHAAKWIMVANFSVSVEIGGMALHNLYIYRKVP